MVLLSFARRHLTSGDVRCCTWNLLLTLLIPLGPHHFLTASLPALNHFRWCVDLGTSNPYSAQMFLHIIPATSYGSCCHDPLVFSSHWKGFPLPLETLPSRETFLTSTHFLSFHCSLGAGENIHHYHST